MYYKVLFLVKIMKSLLLYNIRSMQNVGAIFRNADGAGFEKIYLIGCTPTPPRNDISKTALWAEKTIDWEYVSQENTLIQDLKLQGTCFVSVELDTRSKNYRILADMKEKDICLILWNEVEGIPQKLLDISDEIVMIPMLGQKESLNVSVAAGIAMYATLW